MSSRPLRDVAGRPPRPRRRGARSRPLEAACDLARGARARGRHDRPRRRRPRAAEHLMASDLRRAVVLGPAGCIYPGSPQDYTVAGNPGFFRDTRTRWARMWADWPTLEPTDGQVDAAKFAALDQADRGRAARRAARRADAVSLPDVGERDRLVHPRAARGHDARPPHVGPERRAGAQPALPPARRRLAHEPVRPLRRPPARALRARQPQPPVAGRGHRRPRDLQRAQPAVVAPAGPEPGEPVRERRHEDLRPPHASRACSSRPSSWRRRAR